VSDATSNKVDNPMQAPAQAEVHAAFRVGKLPPERPAKLVCGARCKTRGGEPCRNPPCRDGAGRCRMHGGSPKRRVGVNHYAYKHGKRSRDPLARLVGQYEAHLAEHQANMRRLVPIVEDCLDRMGDENPAVAEAAPAGVSEPR
jgi:hypothetical protein